MLRGSFNSANDGALGRGSRPVVFDVVASDQTTSLLPEGLKMVLYVNPTSMSFTYTKQIDRVSTRGGFVEFHWGDAPTQISFDMATGGFVRLYTGVSAVTAPQGRRQTLAYQKYVDFLALFHNNGALYDSSGTIVQHNYIKMSFDGGVYVGWFDGGLTVTEGVDKPYQFAISAQFVVAKELASLRTQDLGYTSSVTERATTGQQIP